jgi:hypothetical protein
MGRHYLYIAMTPRRQSNSIYIELITAHSYFPAPAPNEPRDSLQFPFLRAIGELEYYV